MADQHAIPAQEATPADLQATLGSEPATTALAPQKAKAMGRKKRTLTDEEFTAYGNRLAGMANAGDFPDKVVPVAHVADVLNVAQHLVDRIINESCLMGKGFSISRTPAKTPSDSTCRIDPRGMCTIPRSFFEKLNDSLPPESQFSPGDELTCTPDGDGFKVTRVTALSPTI